MASVPRPGKTGLPFPACLFKRRCKT